MRAVPQPSSGPTDGSATQRPCAPAARCASSRPVAALDARRRGNAQRRDGVGAGAACPNPDLAPSAESLPAMSDATLCLLNGERADHGLGPLDAERHARRRRDRLRPGPGRRLLLLPHRPRRIGRARPHRAQRLPAARRRLGAGREPRLGHRQPRDARVDHAGLDELARPPRQHPQPRLPRDRDRHRRRQPRRRRRARRDLRDGVRRDRGPRAAPTAEDPSRSRSPTTAQAAERASQVTPRAPGAARRRATARRAHRAHQARRAGKGRGRPAGRRRGRVGHIKARIAI